MSVIWSANNTPVMVDTLGGHTVEIVDLQRRGSEWWVLAAVNGQKLSQYFMEPAGNVDSLGEDALLAHLKEQSIAFYDYERELDRVQ
jgi:hypothetical protein